MYDWLNTKLSLPVFAEAYRGALQLLYAKTPGYVTFVSHIGRDLMNALATTVAGIERLQTQYVNRLDRLQKIWKDEWAGPGFATNEDPGIGHLIPHEICGQVKELIDEHKDGRDRSNRADSMFFSTFLDYEDIHRVPENFLKEWKAAKDWFLSHAHLRKDPFPGHVPSELESSFRTLDHLLYVAATSSFERLKGIDEILEETNG